MNEASELARVSTPKAVDVSRNSRDRSDCFEFQKNLLAPNVPCVENRVDAFEELEHAGMNSTVCIGNDAQSHRSSLRKVESMRMPRSPSYACT